MNDTLGQPGSDSLYSFLSKCLNDEQAKDIQAKFNQNGIEYGDLLQLPEKYINETLKELKVKPWHIGPIVNQLSKIEGSAVYQNSSRSSVVVLPTKQNEYVLALHKNTEIIKENIAKLLETENQINANSKTIISDIDKYYNNLTNILAKQKEKTLKKLDTIKNNKLKIIKQETVKANQALDCLTGANDKLNKIIVDNKLDLTKKQIAVTKHIEAAQKATVTHQPYLKPNMPLKTGPKMKYQPKQQILFEKYVLNMDDVIDNDIDFTNIKFDYDKAKIEWKCDLLALNKDIKFDLQFKNKKSSVDDDEKVQQNEWKSLTELKAKQIAVYLDPDADKDEKLQDNDDDEKSVNNQDEIEFYGDSDDSESDSDDDNDGTINKNKKKQKTTIGLLTELTSYRFRIAVQSSLNNIYSQILTKKTPKFIMPKFKSNMINTAEYVRLIKWIPGSAHCKFKLLFKGTRDGFAASTFHTKCNNKGPTLTIIRSTNNHIFGGYCEKAWTSNGSYQKDDGAWLYLLRSTKGDKPQKFDAKPSSNALYFNSSYGPTYGDGHNLNLANNCDANTSSYCAAQYAYPSIRDANQLAGSSTFKVTDYEVWQISDFGIKSTIITNKEYLRLNKWIKASSPNDYKLLFRASTDGFAASTFHTKCNSKGPTLTIVKSSNNHIFGGYSQISWNSSGSYQKDDNAWLYLLRSTKGDKPQVFKAKPSSNALYFNSNYGPTFGDGHNLHLANNCNQNTSSYCAAQYAYPSIRDNTQLAGASSFKVTDYEVWAIKDTCIPSTIITKTEYQQLNEWIKASTPYQYKLLLRGSTDGFAASTFHSKCDNKGTTLTIVKSNHNHIFGGYAEKSWDQKIANYVKDDNAWLYLLKSAKGDKPQVFKAKPGSNALYFNSGYGPTYGSGHDLYLANNCNSNNSSYSAQCNAYATRTDNTQLAGSYNFKVTDYEVWQINVSKINSTILQGQEFQILNEWVLASGKSQYKLLFRASRDGFASSVFHSKCDDQGTTLVVVQSEHNHVFGGYTEASWKHIGNYVHNNTAKAWIYLLRSAKNDKPEKWTPTKYPQYAIYCNNSYGPTFGGHDFYLSSGCNSNNSSYSNLGHSYSAASNTTKLAGSYNFKVTDYEVWHVF